MNFHATKTASMRLGAIAALSISLHLPGSHADAQEFHGIGFLSSPPYFDETYVQDLSRDGLSASVLATSSSLQDSQAARWTPDTGVVTLGEGPSSLEFLPTVPLGINRDGTAVTGYFGAGGTRAFRWIIEENGGLYPMSFIIDSVDSVGHAVSDDGTVIVGDMTAESGSRAARWVEGDEWSLLGFLPGHDRSVALRVSGDGEVAVGTSWHPDGTSEAFRWTAAGGMVGLGVLPGKTKSAATDVSPDGKIVVGTSEDDGGRKQAFRWTAATGMRSLPFADARRVDACGNVVVGANGGEAVRWTPWGVEDIDRALLNAGASLGTWQLEIATGLSADGRTIAGNGTDPDGKTQGWIATLPLPAARNAGQMCKLRRWKRIDSFPGPFKSEKQCRSTFRALQRSCKQG